MNDATTKAEDGAAVSGELLVHFNQFPWPLASGVERAASLANAGSKTEFIFAGHAVPERGLFLPVPRTMSRLLRVELPEIQNAASGNLTLVSLPTYRRVREPRPLISGWQEFTHAPSWASLQEVSVNGLPGGGAVANYLVRRAGTQQIALSEVLPRIRFLLFSYSETSRLVTSLITDRKPDRIHAYQGNWLNDRAVIDVAKMMNVPHATYGEVAPGQYWHWDRDPYSMTSWRDLDVWGRWCTATEDLTTAEKHQLMDELIRASSSPRVNPFSTSGQWDPAFTYPSGDYVSFFTANSNDERFGLDANWDPFWPDQVEFAEQFGAALADEGCHLVVRVHPNTANKPDAERRRWTDLARRAEEGLARGLTVVPANSPLDSYELARDASASVTWGSNISVELVARGLKTVNVAPAAFDALGVVPLATSLNALMNEIHGPAVGGSQQERAAAWLWFVRTQWPVDFENVRTTHTADGTEYPYFLGHRLAVPTALQRVSRPWSRARGSRLAATLMCRHYRVPS